MCGIVGIFGECVERSLAVRSLQKVSYRGSSVLELKEFPHGVLGANRLPIQGRETGIQPLCNEDETIWACQNGEIFNYLALRGELEAVGHVFKTDCDTELWVHLYEEYGVNAIAKVDSEMFAFVVYDAKKRAVFVGRDRLGVKPLYYGFHSNGNIHFASELKQLTQFEDIQKMFTFPKGSYYYNGVFCRYATELVVCGVEKSFDAGELCEETLIPRLSELLEDAVKKRVQTDLPIGVFLSGGVDSSLIMELATRYHNNVTAIILGHQGSSDYEFALRLCREKGYKHHVVTPDLEYRQHVEEMIYHTETYEPLIIRHAFANDMCSRAAAELGIRVVLLGEGSDEIFAGYNEFMHVPGDLVNSACIHLLQDLEFGHLKRVDRLAMRHTVETRCPFLDDAVVQLGVRIPSVYKIKKSGETTITKYILRKVAAQFLPDYIAWRYKEPFANGAGMDVGYDYKKSDGEISAYIDGLGSFTSFLDNQLQKYGLKTNTEVHHFLTYQKYGYDKLVDGDHRLLVKDTLKDRNVKDMISCERIRLQKQIDSILEYINDRVYRRHFPYRQQDLYLMLEQALVYRIPLSFFLFWGASEKEHMDNFDVQCLLYVKTFFERLGKLFPYDINVTFLLADEHALNNKYTRIFFESYLDEISRAIQKVSGWRVCMLSELYIKYNVDRERSIQEYLAKQQHGRWERCEIQYLLERSAQKYYKGDNIVEGAQSYMAMRMIEKTMLEEYFGDAVFITFGSHKLQSLYPNVPTLYLYSSRERNYELPWFTLSKYHAL